MNKNHSKQSDQHWFIRSAVPRKANLCNRYEKNRFDRKLKKMTCKDSKLMLNILFTSILQGMTFLSEKGERTAMTPDNNAIGSRNKHDRIAQKASL